MCHADWEWIATTTGTACEVHDNTPGLAAAAAELAASSGAGPPDHLGQVGGEPIVLGRPDGDVGPGGCRLRRLGAPSRTLRVRAMPGERLSMDLSEWLLPQNGRYRFALQ